MQILQLPGKIYLSGETLLTFLVDGKLDTVALRQRHPSGAFRADGEHVSKTGREFLSGLVLDELPEHSHLEHVQNLGNDVVDIGLLVHVRCEIEFQDKIHDLETQIRLGIQ